MGKGESLKNNNKKRLFLSNKNWPICGLDTPTRYWTEWMEKVCLDWVWLSLLLELLAGTVARPVPGWPRWLALSKVLTDGFSAAPEAADLMSGFEIHILINMSASSNWQRLSGKENKKCLYTSRRSGVWGVAQHSSGGMAEVLPPPAAGLLLTGNQPLADKALVGGHSLPSCGGGSAPLASAGVEELARPPWLPCSLPWLPRQSTCLPHPSTWPSRQSSWLPYQSTWLPHHPPCLSQLTCDY